MSRPRVLTYCSNIHPGESWNDVLRNLHDHALAVKAELAPAAAFPLGLRLSAQAASELTDESIHSFRDWLDAHGCRVATVNGFPYGVFHGTTVKHAVYEPDWRHAERARYTMQLADILAQWLAPTETGSISTVPIAFRDRFLDEHWSPVRKNLLDTLAHLALIRDRGGPLIRLAIEPEPHCMLETTTEVVQFFSRMNFPGALAEHVGICLDCCHQAVEFERPDRVLAQLREAGITIAKVQVSSALRAIGGEIAALMQFDEPTYLHQAVALTTRGTLARFCDLPDLARWLARGERAEEVRVHFHVPVFLDHLGSVGTTRFFLDELLPQLDPDLPLEVETYSFGVLPASLRSDSIGASIVRELRWVTEKLHDASHRRH
ncbi:MAG TPA: metabolite traffic protein EboE [Povalibacter sp.]|uniref:metabolite traffic protein EboE n=1 Tax=Povalibacter sp. TaxID=1962978 RepID=UPI002B798BDB|nr:metabolite traffic protein EboE [Povalibacter sp.]HMN43054.1 metabolite traffic protein EboE [Povalibacter sp.]